MTRDTNLTPDTNLPDTNLPDTTLPDTGNGMSDRSGYYDGSDSGDIDTPDYDGPATPIGSDFPAEVLNESGMGTTFSDGSAVPLDSSLSETE